MVILRRTKSLMNRLNGDNNHHDNDCRGHTAHHVTSSPVTTPSGPSLSSLASVPSSSSSIIPLSDFFSTYVFKCRFGQRASSPLNTNSDSHHHHPTKPTTHTTGAILDPLQDAVSSQPKHRQTCSHDGESSQIPTNSHRNHAILAAKAVVAITTPTVTTTSLTTSSTVASRLRLADASTTDVTSPMVPRPINDPTHPWLCWPDTTTTTIHRILPLQPHSTDDHRPEEVKGSGHGDTLRQTQRSLYDHNSSSISSGGDVHPTTASAVHKHRGLPIDECPSRAAPIPPSNEPIRRHHHHHHHSMIPTMISIPDIPTNGESNREGYHHHNTNDDDVASEVSLDAGLTTFPVSRMRTKIITTGVTGISTSSKCRNTSIPQPPRLDMGDTLTRTTDMDHHCHNEHHFAALVRWPSDEEDESGYGSHHRHPVNVASNLNHKSIAAGHFQSAASFFCATSEAAVNLDFCCGTKPTDTTMSPLTTTMVIASRDDDDDDDDLDNFRDHDPGVGLDLRWQEDVDTWKDSASSHPMSIGSSWTSYEELAQPLLHDYYYYRSLRRRTAWDVDDDDNNRPVTVSNIQPILEPSKIQRMATTTTLP